jgi:hypothetical protein
LDSLKELSFAINKDIQEFLVAILQLVRFVYKRCVDIQSSSTNQALVQAITGILFTSNDGSVFKLLLKINCLKHQNVVERLERNIVEFADLKLSDLNLHLDVEYDKDYEELRHNRISKCGKRSLFPNAIHMLQELHKINDPSLILKELCSIKVEI